jgi:spore germination cell wall hydrolase CwlJ-like protein
MITADFQDLFMITLTAWRENRGGGEEGMQSVMNTIVNRARIHGMTFYDVCTLHDQYSSVTYPTDPETAIYAVKSDPQWAIARGLAAQAAAGTLVDITDGATSYYALSMKKPPYWAASMTKTVTLFGQVFFK